MASFSVNVLKGFRTTLSQEKSLFAMLKPEKLYIKGNFLILKNLVMVSNTMKIKTFSMKVSLGLEKEKDGEKLNHILDSLKRTSMMDGESL